MNTRNIRKILISALLVSLLVVAALVPGFAKTDAERELEQAEAYEIAAEQQLSTAKQAYAEAQSNSRKGMYGFFQASGADNAVAILDGAKYRNLIAYGTLGDATSLDNLEAALQLIEKTNEYRAKDGLPEQLVTDSLMAMAEADADAYYNLNTAPKQFTVNGSKIAENLGTFATPAAAVESWYNEKSVAEANPEYMDYSNANWYKVGHYYNLSRKGYVVTGAAVNTRLGNKFAQVFFSSANNEPTYTVAQYRERIAAYKASLEEKKQAVDAAETALATAKANRASAQAKVDAEKAADTVTIQPV